MRGKKEKEPKIEESEFSKEQRRLKKKYENKLKWSKYHHRSSTFWYIITAIACVAAVLLLNVIGLILVLPIALIGYLIGKGLQRLSKRRHEEAMIISQQMQQNALDAAATGANLNNPAFRTDYNNSGNSSK